MTKRPQRCATPLAPCASLLEVGKSPNDFTPVNRKRRSGWQLAEIRQRLSAKVLEQELIAKVAERKKQQGRITAALAIQKVWRSKLVKIAATNEAGCVPVVDQAQGHFHVQALVPDGVKCGSNPSTHKGKSAKRRDAKRKLAELALIEEQALQQAQAENDAALADFNDKYGDIVDRLESAGGGCPFRHRFGAPRPGSRGERCAGCGETAWAIPVACRIGKNVVFWYATGAT